MFRIKVFILLFLAIEIHLYSQSLPIEGLFEFDSWVQKKNINLSERIQEAWNVPKSFMQLVYYNANQDNAIDSIQFISRVLHLTRLSNGLFDAVELMDDGNHFDSKTDDWIFGNILIGDFELSHTEHTIIDVLLDTIGIRYSILNPPVKELLDIPEIIFPLPESEINYESAELIWSIDRRADGCEIFLFDQLPIIGQNYEDAIWTKKFEANANHLYQEQIPIPLIEDHEYYLLVIAQVDYKVINNEWTQGSYSLEITNFSTHISDTLKDDFSCQIYPNPFNSILYINYTLPQKGRISIRIFNVIGEEIITLIDKNQSEGDHLVIWDGKTETGVNVSSGMYFCKINYNERFLSNKISLLR